MPARLSRHALAAGVASCALALATAAPASPAPPATRRRAAPTTPAPTVDRHQQPRRHDRGQPRPAGRREADGDRAPDDGATTLAVMLIAGGALFAGAGAGFAGGRRVVLRTH